MSQFMNEEGEGGGSENNELVTATQSYGDDFELEENEVVEYEVVIREDTKGDPNKILNNVVDHVEQANAAFRKSTAMMLAQHTALEHVRKCFLTLDEDEFPILVAASKSVNKFHKYILNVRPGSVDKSQGAFRLVDRLHPPTHRVPHPPTSHPPAAKSAPHTSSS